MPLVDTDDLIDAAEAADILGAASRRVISVWRAQHPDFPAPLIERGGGHVVLWLRQDVETWGRTTGRLRD